MYGKRYRLNFRSGLAAFMLVIYATGTISVDVIHHTLHDHASVELHSGEIEKDSCHRTLYHDDGTNGCDHKAHFKATAKCKYSHVVFQSLQLIAPQTVSKEVFKDLLVLFSYQLSVLESPSRAQPLRGPPTT